MQSIVAINVLFQETSEMSSGEETITEGSDSGDEQSAVVQATHHPIPTIEVEEICVGGGGETSDEDEQGETTSDKRSTENDDVERNLEVSEEIVVQETAEESYDQTVPSDSPLESTEPDSSILEDSSEILEPIPMDTRENEVVTLEESITEFEKIEKQYDLLQEELGFSISSEPTSEEQQWISPRKGVKLEGQTSPSGTDQEPGISSDSQAKTAHEKAVHVSVDNKYDIQETAARSDSQTQGAESKEETKENVTMTISKLTPTREIDLLKELELMEQEVSTMKKVVDEVEANVESRKAKIAELVDDTSYPESMSIGVSEQSIESEQVVKREAERVIDTIMSDHKPTKELESTVVSLDAKPSEFVPSIKEIPTSKRDVSEQKTTIFDVATSESNTDDVSREENEPILNIAGVTASESTTDFELPSSESDMQINDVMTKSLSQNFDLVSLQSLQDNVKLESYVVSDIDTYAKSKPVSKVNKTVESHQRPTNLGAEELLTREAPLASVDSECDDELMRTSSSNASPDAPVAHKPDDSNDIDEELDSTTSESLLESSIKSEVSNKRLFKSFKDSFPVHVSTIAHITPEPPVLVPLPEPKKLEPVVRQLVLEVKTEQVLDVKPVTDSRKEEKISSRKPDEMKRQKQVASRRTDVIPTLGQKLKVEKYDGRPSESEHGLNPVPREIRERRGKRSKSPVDMGIVPAAGGGLQGIGEIVAAAARCRPKLNAAIEEEAIKRIDNLLIKARERREKRHKEEFGEIKVSTQRAQEEEKQGPVSPTASGASEPPKSPPSATRAAVEEHMEALDQLVRESQAAAGISVDESFVNTRDRKKRKRHQSNHSDSSFTISTPSGSVKSCSSISEIESTPNSLGASLDKSNSNDLLGSSTDADVSLSVDQIVDDNSTMDDSNFPKFVETTVINDKTLEQSQGDSSQKDSMQFQSANTTMNDNSNSEYYTPNVSGVEPMDTSENAKDSTKVVNRPKALDSRSTASDGKSLDSLDDSHSSPLYSPRRNLLDAKRNFFFEAAKPVTIDPSRVFNSPTHKNKKNNKNDNGRKDQDGNAIEVGPEEFENEKNANNAKHHQGSPSKRKVGVDPELMREWKSVDIKEESAKKGMMGLDLKRDWQSLDSGSARSPTAGVPKTNVTNGDTDVFYTPGTSLKHPPIADLCADNGLRKPTDTKKRILPDARKVKNNERETARQAAREKARLKSDEELGLEQLSPTRNAAYTKDEIDKKTVNGVSDKKDKKGTKDTRGQKDDTSTKRSSGFFDHYPPLEPEIPCKVSIIGGSMHEAKTRSLQNKATAAAMADYLTPQSSQSKTMKDKRSKSKSPTRAAEVTPSPSPNLQKQDSREDKKDSKEKRRSLLALLLPSKSVEKKEKKTEKEKKSTPKQSKTKSPPMKKQETKTKGIKSPKTSTSPKVPGAAGDQAKKGQETKEGQRTSVYEEFGPVFEENTFSEKNEGNAESKKEKLMERIEQIAPTVSNENTVAPKLPPRATGNYSILAL